MRRLLALAALLACAACGAEEAPAPHGETAPAAAPDPQATLQRFYDALAAGDVEGARALMLPLSDVERRRKLEAELGQAAVLFQGRELAARAVEQKVDEPWAVVVARHVRTAAGALPEVRLRDEFLYRTAEGWRLATEPMRADPAIAPLWDARAAALQSWYRASFDDLSERYR